MNNYCYGIWKTEELLHDRVFFLTNLYVYCNVYLKLRVGGSINSFQPISKETHNLQRKH